MNNLFSKGAVVILALALGACSHTGPHKPVAAKKPLSDIEKAVEGDGPPDSEIDVTHIPNATPKIEPQSRYGNPYKYEVFGKHYYTLPHSKGYAAEGTASWYGRKFHGQRTSSGEQYDMYGMTAAHRSLPLPTYAKIENLKNGKEVIVKINDRGPFVHDRLIDLSYAAAKKLGIHASGTGKVRITAIDPVTWHKQQKANTRLAKNSHAKTNKKATQLAQAGKSAANATKTASTTKAKPKAKATQVAKANKQIYVQLGAFEKKNNAEKLANKATTLTAALSNVAVHVVDKKTQKGAYKVRIGPLKDEKVAKTLQKKFVALNGANPSVVYE
ncbi:MAG: septal ring lytic transglycosylase RlpA family protein [Candidatus Berkiella sp.]